MQSQIAESQYQLSATDLETVLALVRGGTLAHAGDRLGQNASTVFRNLQRIERGLSAPLFVRTRSGYEASDMALTLAEQAEHIEAALATSRAATRQQPAEVVGTVRLTTTDTLLHGVIAPALALLRPKHPALEFELHTGNELASLTRRDADIAVRVTPRPPAYLVGRKLGVIQVALYAAAHSHLTSLDDVEREATPWVAPDDALPEHPSVLWRRKHMPRAIAQYRVASILTAAHLVQLGLGVGILPLFLAREMPGLKPLTDTLTEAQKDVWLLTHPQSRHLRRIATVYSHLSETIRLPQ